ncbi:MAG TPA: Holliday junction resolvase RuvX [Nitrospirales bacterium]|nr:Holliday junction resolvase RuvX [Nitrospirales bacterium]
METRGKRILALDPGTKRIGVAVSDEMGWIAQPLETITRRSVDEDVARIRRLVEEHDVERVIMGWPIRLDGTLGPAAETVQRLIRKLEETLPVPVEPWDERLTTKAAEDLLIAANVSRKKRKGTVDRVAAAILLESYLRARSAPSDDAAHGDEHGHG